MNGVQQSQPQQAVAKRPIDGLKAVIDHTSTQAQFKNALGEHKDAFVASLIDLYTGDKSLQTCNPSLIVAEALRAATLRLPLNKALGFAYIVVYNNKVKTIDPATGRDTWVKVPTPTFIPGYKGYIQLAMRTGQYKTINADLVYEGELKKRSKLSGSIDLNGERISDKVVGYFCYIELLNGFSKMLYMSVEEMASYAKRYSPSVGYNTTVEQLIAKANEPAASKKVGWEGNFNDMALKTVIRRLLSKYGYLSVEMMNAVEKDVEHDSASSTRNEALTEGANVEYIEVDAESVNTETGEVIAPQPAEQTSEQPAAEDGPGY